MGLLSVSHITQVQADVVGPYQLQAKAVIRFLLMKNVLKS
jgi:hypothetical protein